MTNEGRTVHIECQQKIRVHHKPSHKKIGPSISPSSCDPKYGGNKTLLLRTGIDSWTSPSPIWTSWQTPPIHLHVIRSPGIVIESVDRNRMYTIRSDEIFGDRRQEYERKTWVSQCNSLQRGWHIVLNEFMGCWACMLRNWLYQCGQSRWVLQDRDDDSQTEDTAVWNAYGKLFSDIIEDGCGKNRRWN